MYQVHRFSTEDELRAFAKQIINEVLLPAFQKRQSIVLLLEGPMGVGKSTFARFILEESGIEGDFSGSPTYPIILEYKSRSLGLVAHMDLYRLDSEDELQDIGIEEMLSGQAAKVTSVFLIEWGSKFKDFLDKSNYSKLDFISVDIDMAGDSSDRLVELKKL